MNLSPFVIYHCFLTGASGDFCEIYLELNDIKISKTKVRKPQTNGFVQRFNGTVLDESFRKAFRISFKETLE